METRHLIAMIATSWWLNAEACGGGGGDSKNDYDRSTTSTTTIPPDDNTANIPPKVPKTPKKVKINHPDSYDEDIWNGWTPPPGANDYKSFMEKYLEQKKKRQEKQGDIGKSIPADAGADFPPEWEGVGPGIEGVQPPPWAFVPANTGQPNFCLEQPDPGDCYVKEQPRFAYNPYLDECESFMWKCEGNNNNFETKAKCEENCIGAYEGGCDASSRIPFGYL